MILEKLCNSFGVSGCDEEVKKIIIEEISDYCSVEVLKDGNIIAHKKGKNRTGKKFMMFAHTDEVGLIVKSITDDGYLKIDEIGGIDDRILISKKVFVGEKKVPGIIGIKAVHMTDMEEREKTVKIKDLYVDIGATSKEDALKYVDYGDYILFDSKYKELGNGRIKAKALDDRVGVSVLVKLLKEDSEFDYSVSFNSLEEIGLKGAITTTNYFKPDYAVIFEGTTCSDVYNINPYDQSTYMGKGIALSVSDRASTSDSGLNNFISNLAKENNIPIQFKRTNMGGNDAGAVQSGGNGVKTAVLSVPVRYIHSPVSIMDKKDYDAGFQLAKLLVNNIGYFIEDKNRK